MMDPKAAQARRTQAQEQVRTLVARELKNATINFRNMSPVEEALVRAHYNPDKRLG